MHLDRRVVCSLLLPTYTKPTLLVMSSTRMMRHLYCAGRRRFSSTPMRRSAGNGGGSRASSTPSHQLPKWSGRSVIALTATAGILGFGLAASGLQQPLWPKSHVLLFDSKVSTPRYASMHELEIVCRLKQNPFEFFFPLS